MPYMNTDTDQPAHPCNLINVFVIHSLDSIIPIVTVSEIPKLLLSSIAEHISLSIIWLHISKGRFSHDMAELFSWSISIFILKSSQRESTPEV